MPRYYRSPIGSLLIYLTGVVISLIEIAITLRVVLKLFGANTAAPFVNWLYTTTAPFVQPFTGIFPNPTNGRFILDLTAIFALIVYGILAYLIEVGLGAVSKTTSETE